MLIFMSYNGAEPDWASALRESRFPGVQVYSPALTLESQIPSLGDDLVARKPCVPAYEHSEALKLDKTLWMPFSEALPTLMAADSCTVTSQMVWRDLYILTRSDALVVDARTTNELALYAALMNIPVAAVSYQPTGLHPWLTHVAQVTINSPENIGQILDALAPNSPNIEAPEEAAPDCPEDCDEHETCRE